MSKQEKSWRVIAEIKSRGQQGRPLNSGANRGDWLYAAAVDCFGSWGAAVQAAGFRYKAIHQRRPMSPADVLKEIRQIVRRKEPLVMRRHLRLAAWARRHFGSWASAVREAGYEPRNKKWTHHRFTETVRAEIVAGRSLAAKEVIGRMGESVYKAGCRLHGSWKNALEAVSQQMVVQALAGRRQTPGRQRVQAGRS